MMEVIMAENVASNSDVKGFKTHEKLWSEDGNVVLITENTGFRVYKGILSRKSPIFRDLFTLPQPADAETFEECPVVRLSDDSSLLADFLDVLYFGRKFRKQSEFPTWNAVRAMLCLGTKYQIDEFREEAVYQLQLTFPDDIALWDATYDDGHRMSYPHEENIAIANAVRTCNLPDIFIRTLYSCCQLDTNILVCGYKNAAGAHEQLCPEDIKRCFDARIKLITPNFELIESLFALSSNCGSVACESAQQSLYADTRQSTVDLLSYDPLTPHVYWVQDLCHQEGLCQTCKNFYITRHNKSRQQILTDLGKYI